MDEAIKTPDTSSGAWYTAKGNDCDIVISSRVRLARNLANFEFPSKMEKDDFIQVQSIVLDAFNHFEAADKYQSLAIKSLEPVGLKILEERHIFDDESYINGGVVMRTDEKVCCTINIKDHVRIASFVSGLDFDQAFLSCHDVDAELQKGVQFAASYDYGYLTSSIKDCGSGMKLSILVHLPCLSIQHKIRILSDNLLKKGLAVTAAYGAGENGSSLGYYYLISSLSSSQGSEVDQLCNIKGEALRLIEIEREERDDVRENMTTVSKNILCRSLALAKNSLFIPLREAVTLIGSIKLGLSLGFIKGISDITLSALLYRIQNAHLEYIMTKGNFNFEKDIENSLNKKIERLRAILLQEAFEDIEIAL